MNLYILLKMVPDTVEELNVSPDGKGLDAEFLRYKLSEPDDHALEQALILKEKHGGHVTVVALDAPEVDDVLFTALAKGADRAVKIPVNPSGMGTVAAAKVLSSFFAGTAPMTPETILMPGSQAIDDLEGEVAPLLAAALNLPYVGVVCGVARTAPGTVAVLKEFAGGLRAEFEVALPAVLGIQSAEKPPRYVPVAKVRAVMKSATIEEAQIEPPDRLAQLDIERMYKPEGAGRAEIIEGTPEEVSDRLMGVLEKVGVV